MDSEKFSFNTSTSNEQSSAYTVKNLELAQFGILLPISNPTEANKVSNWKFASMDGSVKGSKSMAHASSSFDREEIFQNSVTTKLSENIFHNINVPRSNTDAAGKIAEIGAITCVTWKIVNEATDYMVMDIETNRNNLIESEMIDNTGIGSKATNISAKSSGKTDVTELSCEISNSTDIDSKMTDASEISIEISSKAIDSAATDVPRISSATIDDPRISSATTNDPRISSATTDDPSISSAITDNPRIIRATTDDPRIIRATTDDPRINSAITDDPRISSATTNNPRISIATAVGLGNRSATTDAIGISSVITEISSEATDGIGINSETGSIEIRSATTDGLKISIVITDVTGINTSFTYETGFDNKTTDYTKIHCDAIDTIEIRNGKYDSAIMNNEINGYAEKRNQTNITMDLKETFKATEIISEIMDCRRVGQKLSDPVSKVNAKSTRESTEKIGSKSYTQAKTIIRFKSKIPKASKNVLNKFTKEVKQTHGSKKTSCANSQISIETKPTLENCYDIKNCAKNTFDIEKFLDAVDLTNKDMLKKNGILLKKQKLVAEVLSYVHAVQSIFRLSSPSCLVTNDFPTNSKPNVGISSDKQFYKAGNYILDELKLFQSELKADFQDWEACRKKILVISETMPYEFELCETDKSVRVLMHELTSDMCIILKRMESISLKSQEKNEECIDLMDGIDTYITFSSAFIMGGNTLPIL